jgi:hypothetical protein
MGLPPMGAIPVQPVRTHLKTRTPVFTRADAYAVTC